jgi:hypothetical protein
MDLVKSARAAGVLSMAAALAHLLATPGHLAVWWGYGVLFALAALLEAALGIGVFSLPPRPRLRPLYLGGAALHAGTLAVWAVSRTVGVPFGPEAGTVEPLGPLDGLSKLLEAASGALLLLLAAQAGRQAAPGPTPDAGRAA